ncbi:DUF2889 domain-containing protein [Sphingorhabdus sp.]|uniref:DUF2889 domain-containing protein n=1 Tax=Sphingorhabdus sp. TaxID=1902408 RepID=UPI00405482FE
MGDAYPRIGGCLRRRIDIRRNSNGAVVAWLEDDFHHLGLTLEHDGERVTDIRVASERLPFTTCPLAEVSLKNLVGQELSRRSTDIGAMVKMREQCTHMFDLAGLAMAQAAAGRDHRHYEAIVADREIVAWEAGTRRLLGPGEAWLLCDNNEVLRWTVDQRAIIGPAEWAGQALVEGFRGRTEDMPIEQAEAASVLRRAIMVAGGRSFDPDTVTTAADRWQRGVCYTFLEENRADGLRNFGNALNYEDSGDGMLAKRAEKP